MSATGPLFSIVTPVYDPPVGVLRETVESVLAQDFGEWELILVDDCSTDPEVRRTLAELAAGDSRIRVIEREVNGHIVAASNDGVTAATGEFIALLDHDDLLVDTALSRIAETIAKEPDVDYLYSDEDKVDDHGAFYDAFHKPEWSPERQRGQNYTSHLSVLRTEVVRAVGGFREGYDGSQDHDLVLRVTERARKVVHVPEVLYHWRTVPGSAASDVNAKPYAAIAGERAVQHHLDRLGIDAEVGQGPVSGLYTISRRLDPARRVSIVIPTMGSSGLVWGVRRVFIVEAVRSLLEHTQHENLEVVVVYDQPTPDAVMTELRDLLGDRLVPVLSPETKFNFSRKMNLGVVHATGDRIVLLNDDVEVRSERWLEELVAPLDEPDVGMTGAKLYFSDDTIQHVGHRYADGHFHHIAFNRPRTYLGEFGGCAINREVSGVTAACAALTRETYERVGGFTETLPVNFNDVDLSYKVRSHLGLRIVVVARVELFHFESQTRVPRVEPWERMTVTRRWGRPGRDAFAPTVEAVERP
jgi:glycosyltransferase involved in cell wall biosynthesis